LKGTYEIKDDISSDKPNAVGSGSFGQNKEAGLNIYQNIPNGDIDGKLPALIMNDYKKSKIASQCHSDNSTSSLNLNRHKSPNDILKSRLINNSQSNQSQSDKRTSRNVNKNSNISETS